MNAFLCVFSGGCIGLVYLALLWGTLWYLPKTRHKGLLLMASMFGRLALILVAIILLSQKNVWSFSWIMGGFLGVRFISLTYEKRQIKRLIEGAYG